MVHIQLRRGSAIPANERHEVGEPLWDDVNSRFGVFNNRAPTAVEWYPRVIGNKMLMNPDQTLGGLLPNGDEHNLYLDWSTQDVLYIRNRNTNAIYATFAAVGASFNAVGASGVPYGGITNLLLNGNLAVKRGAIPITTVDTNNAQHRSSLIAPNWQMWKSANSTGRLIAAFDGAGSRPYVGCPGVLQVQATAAPNSAGLRVFMHGYEALDGQQTFACYIIGPNGAKTQHRAITENGSILFTKEVTATGSWQRVLSTFTPPQDGSRWAGFDVLYNPSGNTPATQTWRVGGASLQNGPSASVIESRPEAIERALCASIYQEGRVRLGGASEVAYVGLNNFRYGLQVDAAETASKAVTVSDKDPSGFSLAVPSLSAASNVKFAAYMMPTTLETA